MIVTIYAATTIQNADDIELTCIPTVSKKKKMSPFDVLSTDPNQIFANLTANQPRIYKVLVSKEFYDKNNLNLFKNIDIEITKVNA